MARYICRKMNSPWYLTLILKTIERLNEIRLGFGKRSTKRKIIDIQREVQQIKKHIVFFETLVDELSNELWEKEN